MLLTIVVLSYNRPSQIKRILENLVGVASEDIKLIIKDDLSPRRSEIVDIVGNFKPLLRFDLELHLNKVNLGYDLNLLDAFDISSSEYVFLLSDDDYLLSEGIPALLEIIKKREHKVYFCSYRSGNILSRYSLGDYDFGRFYDVIYNSILFSGLIFSRDEVLRLEKDLIFLESCIYSQVYLASKIIYKEKDFGFIDHPNFLMLGGDGENFFGKNSSAKNSEVLSDRNHILSNLRYQKFLLKTIEKISLETDSAISFIFMKEYKRRLLAYALRVRSSGSRNYLLFINNLDQYQRINGLLVFFIYIIPAPISRFIYMNLLRTFRKAG